MTTAALENTTSSRAGTGLAAWIARQWRLYCAHRSRRATVQVLMSLSDATLRDIGLHRSEIASLAFDTTGERTRALLRR